MVEKVITEARNVLDFRSYQQARKIGGGNAAARSASGLASNRVTGVVRSLAPNVARLCRHCGAALLEGESDDDCSSAGLVAPVVRAPPRRFYAE